MFMNKTSTEICNDLFVSRRTIKRIVSLFRRTGDVKAKKTGRPTGATLSDYEEYLVCDIILNNAKNRQHEIASEIENQTAYFVEYSTGFSDSIP